MQSLSDSRGKVSKPKLTLFPPIPQTLFLLECRSAPKSVSVYGSPFQPVMGGPQSFAGCHQTAAAQEALRQQPVISVCLSNQSPVDRFQTSKVSSRASTSVSNDWSRDMRAAPRSHVFSEPICRSVGSWRGAPRRSRFRIPPGGCTPTSATGPRAATARSSPRVSQVLFDKFAESQPLIQFPNEYQATVRSDTRPLGIDFQRSIERELKRLILFLTHWVCTFKPSSMCPHPNKCKCQRTSGGP